jgi:hypothetical protein
MTQRRGGGDASASSKTKQGLFLNLLIKPEAFVLWIVGRVAVLEERR